MAKSELGRPTLYLDVDGVILPFDRSPFEIKTLNGLYSYAPEVVRRIGSTCLELVWCTSWGKRELAELVDEIDALRNGRQLELPGANTPWIARKLDAAISDQEIAPTPFVWADDDITSRERDEIERLFADRPHLLVQPDRRLGVDEVQLRSIEDFAHRFE